MSFSLRKKLYALGPALPLHKIYPKASIWGKKRVFLLGGKKEHTPYVFLNSVQNNVLSGCIASAWLAVNICWTQPLSSFSCRLWLIRSGFMGSVFAGSFLRAGPVLCFLECAASQTATCTHCVGDFRCLRFLQTLLHPHGRTLAGPREVSESIPGPQRSW